MRADLFSLLCAWGLALAGVVLGFWPLAALGLLCAALTGHSFSALALGVLCDIAYGAPVGHVRLLFFPFTLGAVVLIAAAAAAGKYFFEHEAPRL